MQIHTSDNPAKEAAIYLSKAINSHCGDVLCLLSGGSALAVVEYITTNESECRTIFMMGDERVSREADINNYLQLKRRYPGHPVTQQLIETVPNQDESAEEFADRIEKNIFELVSGTNNLKVIALMGLGDDGHTAGIFPMDKDSFRSTYGNDESYVHVHAKDLTIDSRASITPSWIQNHVDEIFMIVTGENKYAILESLINESKELHERPAELLKSHRQVHLYTNIAL